MTYDPQEIATLQKTLTARWHEEPLAATGGEFLLLVEENHLRNCQLWHEEDTARRDDLGSERVHQAKRAIDSFNQERNNFIEEMDKVLVAALKPLEAGVPRNSETPGMMIDRLSILALKEFHTREEANREDAPETHRANCAEKLLESSGNATISTKASSSLSTPSVPAPSPSRCITNLKCPTIRRSTPQLYQGKK